jgi:hypothetical protein
MLQKTYLSDESGAISHVQINGGQSRCDGSGVAAVDVIGQLRTAVVVVPGSRRKVAGTGRQVGVASLGRHRTDENGMADHKLIADGIGPSVVWELVKQRPHYRQTRRFRNARLSSNDYVVNTNLTLDRMTTPAYLVQKRVVIRKDPISFLDGVGYHLLCT